jgi:hypothetical protein
MNTTRAAALLRASGRTVLTVWLVLLLLVSALASHNHCLHEWLHADHQSPAHHCLVTTLEQGQTEVATVVVPVVPAESGALIPSAPCDSFFVIHDRALHPGRGPPALS